MIFQLLFPLSLATGVFGVYYLRSMNKNNSEENAPVALFVMAIGGLFFSVIFLEMSIHVLDDYLFKPYLRNYTARNTLNRLILQLWLIGPYILLFASLGSMDNLSLWRSNKVRILLGAAISVGWIIYCSWFFLNMDQLGEL